MTYGHGVIVNRKTVRKIMRLHGLHGLPGSRKRFRSKANIATTADLVQRRFDRPGPNQLVTDITEHPTREGKAYCRVVLDVFSRRVVGWSIDSHQATPLVTNALGMAITNRNPEPDQTVIHNDPLNPGSSPPGRSPSGPRTRGWCRRWAGRRLLRHSVEDDGGVLRLAGLTRPMTGSHVGLSCWRTGRPPA